jgi:putative membrane protein
MKRINYYKLLIIPALILIALLTLFCKPRESQVDSQDVAEEKNKEKFTTKEARQDAAFITGTVASSLAEVRLADLALSKSRDDEIRQVAVHIKNDHSLLLSDLKTYAAKHVISVPLTESEHVRKRILKLEGETDQFNKKWCNEVWDLHKESIETLENVTEKVSDPELQEWIASTLPRLRKNLDLVSASRNRVQ